MFRMMSIFFKDRFERYIFLHRNFYHRQVQYKYQVNGNVREQNLMICEKKNSQASYKSILTFFKSVVSSSGSLFPAGKTTLGTKPVFKHFLQE